jgi:hypothetical protein
MPANHHAQPALPPIHFFAQGGWVPSGSRRTLERKTSCVTLSSRTGSPGSRSPAYSSIPPSIQSPASNSA